MRKFNFLVEHANIRSLTAKDLLVENVNEEARDSLRQMVRVRYENYCVKYPHEQITAEEYMESLGYV